MRNRRTYVTLKVFVYTLLFALAMRLFSPDSQQALLAEKDQNNPNSLDMSRELSFGETLVRILLAPPRMLYAAPPSSTYTPGETLDPSCSPGDTNCTVNYPVAGSAGNIQFNDYSTFGGENSLFYATSTGNLGVGTSSPYAKLSVTGEVVANNFTATSTSATSTFPNASITNLLFGSDYITDLTGSGLSIVAGALTSSAGADHVYPFDAVTDWGATAFGTTTPIIFQGGIGTTATSTFNATTTFGSRVYQTGLGNSTFFGYQAGENDDLTDNNNTAFGYLALDANTTGGSNVAIGVDSLGANTTGGNNVAMGLDSLSANTTGVSNVAIGSSALGLNTVGQSNVSIGHESTRNNITGNYNSALGYQALNANTTGTSNVALGAQSLLNNASATSTVAIGYRAGYGSGGSANSQNNVFLGHQSGSANTTGDNNTLLGYQSGDNISSGSNNLIIGYDIDAQSATASNQLSIGNLIFSEGIDGTGTTLSTGNLGIGTTSPGSKLSVNGDAFISGTTTASALSLKGQNTGIEFPDGSIQTRAYATGTPPAGSSGSLQINNGGVFATLAGLTLDTTGNSRGIDALDIQTNRSVATQVASGNASLAFGYQNSSGGLRSSAIGYSNNASDEGATAIGYDNTASGYWGATSVGYINTASGDYGSLAFGASNTASGSNGSSAFGYNNTASADRSSSFGFKNTSSGAGAVTLGFNNRATASSTAAIGFGVKNYLINSVQIGPSDAAKLTILSTGQVGLASTSPTYLLHVPGEGYFSSYVDASYFVATSTSATSTFAGGLKLNLAGSGIEFQDGTIQTTASSGGSADHVYPFDAVTDWGATAFGTTTPIIFQGGIGTTATSTFNATTTFGSRVYQTGLGNSTFFGYQAGENDDLTDNNNTAFGYKALLANSSGDYNTALGYYALSDNTTGGRNVAIGYSALGSNSVGVYNVALGYRAGQQTEGSNNILLGYQAGDNLSSGSNNLIIGYDIDAQSATASNQLSIGNLIFSEGIDGTGTTLSTGNLGIGTTSPYAKLSVNGNIVGTSINLTSTSITSTIALALNIGTTSYSGVQELVVDGTIFSSDLYGGGTTLETDANGNIIRTPSDQKLKKDITPITDALSKVLELEGVYYNWKDSARFGDQTEIGLIAQEVEKVVPEVVRSGGEYKSLNYQHLVALLINAIQELNTKVDNLALSAGGVVGDIKDLVVGKLKVGSPSKPTGIVLYDELTGEPYCLSISGGKTKTRAGECDEVEMSHTSSGGSRTVVPPEETPIEEQATNTEDVVEEEPIVEGKAAITEDDIVEEPVVEEVVETPKVVEPEPETTEQPVVE